MEGPTAFHYFQKFCTSSGRGWRDLLHLSISRNSAHLEVGGGGTYCISLLPEILHFQRSGWRDLLQFTISRNSIFLEVGGGRIIIEL